MEHRDDLTLSRWRGTLGRKMFGTGEESETPEDQMGQDERGSL